MVKKYTAALLIIMILWFVIGFLFTREYAKLNVIGSTIAAVIMVIIIVQIERQIILGSKNNFTALFRIVIALVMAILGSVIIDQLIFKEDIGKQKLLTVGTEVEELLPHRSKEIKEQIISLDTIISQKETERQNLIEELSLNPTIKIPSSSTKQSPSKVLVTKTVNGENITSYKDTTLVQRTYSTTSIPNPKGEFLPTLDKQIEKLRVDKNMLSQKLIDVKENLRAELLETKGFLDELELMFSILTSSYISGGIWILWFLFFLAIELFVLVSKLGDSESDYDKMIEHQKDIRIQAIDALVNK